MTPLIGGIGWQEILLVAAVIFVLFGASRIPTAFRSLGEGLRSFKEGLSGHEDSGGNGSGSKGGDSPAPAPSEDNGSPTKPA